MNDPEKEILTECPRCGKMKPDVTTDFSPYCQEIHGEDVEMTACSDCFHEDAMDI